MNDEDNKHIFTAILNEGKEKVLILYYISYISMRINCFVQKTKDTLLYN